MHALNSVLCLKIIKKHCQKKKESELDVTKNMWQTNKEKGNQCSVLAQAKKDHWANLQCMRDLYDEKRNQLTKGTFFLSLKLSPHNKKVYIL